MDEVTQAQAISGYAAALLAVARAEGDADRISDELYRVSREVSRSNELRETLSDARIPVDRKLGIVSDLLGERVSEKTVALVDMLVSTGRIRDFEAIADRITELLARAEEQVVAEVKSAIELDKAMRDRLAEKLTEAIGKPVTLQVIVDPELIGGVVARVDDTVFDGSVRSRLRELREAWG